MLSPQLTLENVDPEIWHAIKGEIQRQEEYIELIASENYASPAVMQAQGSVLTNKYAEGYPGKRYYGGCEYVDMVEQLAIDRAKASVWRRVCECPAAFGFTGERRGIFYRPETRRYAARHVSRPWRPPDPWRFRQSQRQDFQRRFVRAAILIPRSLIMMRSNGLHMSTSPK